MATTLTDTATATQMLDELFGGATLNHVGFRLWDQTRWPDERPRDATLVLQHPGALRRMFAAGSEKALAEAYLRNDFDVEGDMEAAFELADLLGQRDASWLDSLKTYFHLRRLPSGHGDGVSTRSFGERDDRAHTVPRDRDAVTFHYNISNDFYRLWLDRQMVYSCAYFERPELSLDDAQEAKLRHLCRKLRLRAGQRLLDIGCGWGALALHAAQNHGVRVTGVTLSSPQAELARERVRAAGLQDAVTIEVRDYRELHPGEKFDAIVSVGMSEHVGRTHLAEYFRHAATHLQPGGVFLNHAIGEGVRPRRRLGASFIDAYVFPDGDIPALPLVLGAAESAGLEVRDVENLREHYMLTLRQWVRRLEQAHDQSLWFVDEPTYRTWRLYMAGSAHGFERAQLAVYQSLLVKPDAAGGAHLPRTRADWYQVQ